MALAPACQPRGRRGAERGFLADFCGFCPDMQGPLTIARRSPVTASGARFDASRSRFAVRLPVKNARVLRFGSGRDFRAGRG